jgi:hypothetical protein
MESIYDIVFEKIKKLLEDDTKCYTATDLIEYGNIILNKEINSEINIWYPLNICINNYYDNQLAEFCKRTQSWDEGGEPPTINKEDVIKIDLGLEIQQNKYRMTKILCKKYENIENVLNNKIIKKITKLKQEYSLIFNPETKNKSYINLNDNEPLTTDIIRIIIENELLKYDLEAIPNCISQCQSDKWIYLNYKKQYDSEDYVIGEPNYCFDIEEGDFWSFNIICYKKSSSNLFKQESAKTDIYQFTENKYHLKSQLSKKFYSENKKKNSNKIFRIKEPNSKDAFALNDLVKHNLIINKQTLFDKNNNEIYVSRFDLLF